MHLVALAVSALVECIEEFLRIQSDILREEIEEEAISRATKDLACE